LPARSRLDVSPRSLLFLLGGLCVMFFGISLLLADPGRDPVGPALIIFLGLIWFIYAVITNKRMPQAPRDDDTRTDPNLIGLPRDRPIDIAAPGLGPRKIRAPKRSASVREGGGQRLGEALRAYDDTGQDQGQEPPPRQVDVTASRRRAVVVAQASPPPPRARNTVLTPARKGRFAEGARRSTNEEDDGEPFVADVDALVPCPTCGADVPFDADKCPSCGWRM